MLDTLDALSTFEEDTDKEMLWDNRIERSAQYIVEKIHENLEKIHENLDKTISERRKSETGSNQSTASSTINVNLDDYLRIFPNKQDVVDSSPRSSNPQIEEKQSQIRSSTINASPSFRRSYSDMQKSLSTPDHFPSINISLSNSNDENFEEKSKSGKKKDKRI